MKFLGISYRNHDANISFSDGKKIKYLKLEREFQNKHQGCINYYHIQYVLNKWNVEPKDINAVAYVTDMSNYQLDTYSDDLVKEYKPKDIYLENFKCPFFLIDHHYAHTLSIWPIINNTDIDFVLDGMGDFEKTYSIFSKNKLLKSYDLDEAESIGRCLAGNIAYINNITGHWADHAGKLMGLKSYGKVNEEYLNLFNNEITEVIKLTSHRKYLTTNTIVEKNQLNYLASVHSKLEQIVLNFFKKNTNKNDIISYTGGVAQNSVINGILKNHFPNLTIPPHCPDDGLSLGLIEFLRQHYNQETFEKTNFPFWQDDFSPKREPTDETISQTAEWLAQGKIVGWYQGNGELGPRALGNRSILMNPSIPNGKHIINQKVKKREWFRPFGASILEEHTNKFFKCNYKSEYMLYVTEVIEKQKFNSITHVDGTCRIQTVGNSFNLFKRLIDAFHKKTGIPMLLNTSMNVNGKPIASRYIDALDLISNTELDILVIGNEIYKR